jgi:hypothetical protein
MVEVGSGRGEMLVCAASRMTVSLAVVIEQTGSDHAKVGMRIRRYSTTDRYW